jgi:hypothetical protein
MTAPFFNTNSRHPPTDAAVGRMQTYVTSAFDAVDGSSTGT